MDITSFFLKRRTFSIVLMLIVSVAGFFSFLNLGRLEDPEFTIKTALVLTQYPGASAEEVEQEVTDRLETSIQSLGEVDHIRSVSRPGVSIIFVDLKPETSSEKLPQTWDKLRNKVDQAAGRLPPGAGPAQVNSDWGDVYGIFYSISGDGYTLTELEDIAKDLKQDMLQVDGVGSVELWGTQPEALYVEMPRTDMSQLGMSPMGLFQTLQGQSALVPSGQVRAGEQDVRIRPTGEVDSVERIGETLVKGRSENITRLRDHAKIYRGTWDTPPSVMYFDGKPALGMGISTAAGGSVVKTGEAVQAKLAQVERKLPLGVELEEIYYQPESVDNSVTDFVVGLVEAIVIVIALLLLFMGLRSGLIIGGVLLITILASFIFMDAMDINLQRISLGALVIALGMLVDNAIVVVEGILVKLQQGVPRIKAARDSVAETQWPLLGATFIAILAFAAISLSPDSVGEFLASLFQVIAISLLLSWVLAVTITPLLAVIFLKVKPGQAVEDGEDVYRGPFFRIYRTILRGMIRWRLSTIAATGVIFFGSIYAFGFVKQNFFPDSAQPQFIMNYWKAEGTHIRHTEADLKEISAYLQKQDGVKHVSTFVGRGALRFQLTYESEMPNSSYGQLLVEVDDRSQIEAVRTDLVRHIEDNYPDAQGLSKRFALGPSTGAKIIARFQGPDATVLRELSQKAQDIYRAEANATHIRDNWRSRVPVIKPEFNEAQARRAGVTRADLSQIFEVSTSGSITGLYREGDSMIPIVFRLPEDERTSAEQLLEAQVWSRTTGAPLPARGLLNGVSTVYEDNVIHRRDKTRTISVYCDPQTGQAVDLFRKVRPSIEAIPLPPGYSLEWGGEHESSTDANARMAANIPLCFVAMVLIVIALFNEIRTPIVIFSLLPLAIIGVALGLLVFDQPFGFMATLGVLSLAGMMIKNAIVLVEQIKLNQRAGMAPLASVIEAGVSRARPVAMAAFTTVLGMIPLLNDVFFGPMAVTIMAGLAVATVLTLLLLPVLYATLYRLHA